MIALSANDASLECMVKLTSTLYLHNQLKSWTLGCIVYPYHKEYLEFDCVFFNNVLYVHVIRNLLIWITLV